MNYYSRRRGSSIFDVFTLNPLPYPVLFVLLVISIFLGISFYFNYEDVVETAETQMGWILFITPILLLLLARWLSTVESDLFGAKSPWDHRRRTYHPPSEGGSPWGVAAMIVLLLILVQYQSSFLDSWFI